MKPIFPPSVPCRAARAAWLLACGLLLLPAMRAAAVGNFFEVRSASTELRDGVWYLSARLDLRLSDEAAKALESGIDLSIQVEIDLDRRRRFLPDADVAELVQTWQLSYQPLTERYVVRNLNSGKQASFVTLFSALNTLGRISDLPFIDAALLEPGASYEAKMRAAISRRDLPGPLRVLMFWRDDFRLESDWYRWIFSN